MRWVASMVADAHRMLTRGSIFLSPWGQRESDKSGKSGKLGLISEAKPMAIIIEQAAGTASNAHERILDRVSSKLHQRVSVMLGSKDEVVTATTGHAAVAT